MQALCPDRGKGAIVTDNIQDAVGKTADFQLDEFTLPVKIVAVKQAYGRLMYQIELINWPDNGRKWVNADRVRLDDVQ